MSEAGENRGLSHDQEAQEFAAERLSLWKITFGPLVWSGHFLLSYAGMAVFCAKVPDAAGLFWAVRLAAAALTGLALGAILWLGWLAWRQWDVTRDREWENESGNNEDRHQFLGHAAFLLAVISAIGVTYVGLPFALIGSCR